MKMTSTDIRKKTQELTKTISKYWGIIATENVAPKGVTRNFDLKVLYTKIQELAEERTKYKTYALGINLGFISLKAFNDAVPDNLYPVIFELGEKQEQYVKLGKISTINPAKKAKIGKLKLKDTEVLTSAFIEKEKSKLQIEINALSKKLDEFNAKANFDISTTALSIAA